MYPTPFVRRPIREGGFSVKQRFFFFFFFFFCRIRPRGLAIQPSGAVNLAGASPAADPARVPRSNVTGHHPLPGRTDFRNIFNISSRFRKAVEKNGSSPPKVPIASVPSHTRCGRNALQLDHITRDDCARFGNFSPSSFSTARQLHQVVPPADQVNPSGVRPSVIA